jgi:DNA polymerase-3 subunit gamma/tau
MGNYIVSARKYRPTGFEEVVGQDHITTTLTNAIKQDQLAQALLFCGPRGVGKTTCARIVANMINGFDQQNDQGSSTAMNIYELDAASNNSVDDIRNLIDQVRYPPQYGRYKVYIIDEVHMLSNQAFNAFLKTLEEPPSYAIFILATTEKHKVIPTILSRCQIFDFNRIQILDITERLENIAQKENIEAEHEALHLLAQKADGALRDALSLFDLIVTYSSGNKITYKDTAKNLHILDYDYYFEITDKLLQENLSKTLTIFNDILKKGFDGQNFIVGLAEHLRNLLISQDTETINLLEVSENVKSRYLEQSKVANKGFLLSALNIINQCDIYYKGSKNQRLHVEIALMKMAHLKSALKLKDIPHSLAQEPKKKQPEVKPEPITIPKEKFLEQRPGKPEALEQKSGKLVTGEQKSGEQVKGEQKPEKQVKGEQKPEKQVKGEQKPEKQVKGEQKSEVQVKGEQKSEKLVTGVQESEELVTGEQKSGQPDKVEQKTDQSKVDKRKTEVQKPDLTEKTNKVSKKTVSIPDINELKNRTGQPAATREVEKEQVIEVDKDRQNQFSEDQLKKEWDAFTTQLKKEGKDNEYNLMTQDFELLDDHTITIHISNSIEQDILVRFKTELLKHLRDNLKNDQIKIDTTIKKVEKSEKIYTNTDKFNHLAKKNPNLIKLKNKFGLDTEF